MLRLLLVLSTLLAASAAQDPVRELRRVFRPQGGASDAFAARNAALDALPPCRDARSFDALIEAWTTVHAEARQVERKRVRPAEQKLPSVTEMGERADLDRCLRLLGRIEEGLAGAAEAAVERALVVLSTPSLPVQVRAVLAPLAARAPDAALPRLRELLQQTRRADDAWVGLRALAALGKAGTPGGPEAVAWLGSRDAWVRAQAARTIAAIEHRAGAGALIDQLGGDDARWQQTVTAALTQLTGANLGTAASWRAWWEAEGEAFVRDGRAKARPARRPVPAADATRSTYFGIPQDGGSVLYLVDFSRSMQQTMEGDDPVTRWQACTRELGQAIDRLAPGQSFNVVVFAERVLAWSERQMPADARSVAAAKAWLADLELELGTAVFEAFEVAFALAGVRLEDRAYAPLVDTIFFLSDGLPTVRLPQAPRKLEPDDPDLVRALVRRHNPVGAIVVHSIMLGRAGGGPFMRQLAADNGGRFVRR